MGGIEYEEEGREEPRRVGLARFTEMGEEWVDGIGMRGGFGCYDQ